MVRESSSASARPALDAVLLLGLLAVLLGALLSWPAIVTRGEAREGLVVRELVGGGDWILPRRQGVIASKPPLYHWLSAGVVLLSGWSDAAVRSPSVLGAWLLLVETFALGSLLLGRGPAWLAVGILCGTWDFWRSALEARVDMLFAAAVGGSLTGAAWWAIGGWSPGRHVFWLAAAAAVLVKGPIGALLPALVWSGFLLSGRELGRWRQLWSWPAAAAAAAATVGWYGAALAAGGREFLAVQLVRENLDRFVGRGAFAPTRAFGWLTMPRYFLGHLAPWNLAVLDDLRRRHAPGARRVAGRLLHAWWIGVLAVFAVAAGKRAVYLLPLHPAIALLAARAAWRATAARRARGALAAVVAGAAIVMLVLAFREQARDLARSPLPPLARTTAAIVPRTAPLHASTGLSENDLLVLAYLLDRPIPRRRVTCAGGAEAYYLRPVPSRAGATPVERVARLGHLELVRCPGIPSLTWRHAAS